MGGPAPAAFSSAAQTYMCRPRGRVQVAIKGEQSNVLLFAGIAFPQRFLQVAGVARAQPLHGRSYGALKSADSLRPSTCMSCLATRSWSWWSAWSGLSTSTQARTGPTCTYGILITRSQLPNSRSWPSSRSSSNACLHPMRARDNLVQGAWCARRPCSGCCRSLQPAFSAAPQGWPTS